MISIEEENNNQVSLEGSKNLHKVQFGPNEPYGWNNRDEFKDFAQSFTISSTGKRFSQDGLIDRMVEDDFTMSSFFESELDMIHYGYKPGFIFACKSYYKNTFLPAKNNENHPLSLVRFPQLLETLRKFVEFVMKSEKISFKSKTALQRIIDSYCLSFLEMDKVLRDACFTDLFQSILELCGKVNQNDVEVRNKILIRALTASEKCNEKLETLNNENIWEEVVSECEIIWNWLNTKMNREERIFFNQNEIRISDFSEGLKDSLCDGYRKTLIFIMERIEDLKATKPGEKENIGNLLTLENLIRYSHDFWRTNADKILPDIVQLEYSVKEYK